MACTLKKSLKPGVDFEGISGADFTITIDPLPGSTLRMVAQTYGDTTIQHPIAIFTVLPGKNLLTIVYAAVQNGEYGYLAEICNGDPPCRLRRIRSTSDLVREYIVEGIEP